MTAPQDIPKLVEHLFRHKSGQMLSTLTRIFGPAHIDLAESVVQEALIKALHLWPFQGVPKNPSAWMISTAKNLALDHLRRESNFLSKEDQIVQDLAELPSTPWEEVDSVLDQEFQDDELRMLFMCAHPLLNRDAQIALSLKSMCAFSVEEIAKAFQVNVSAVEQKIVRAKKKIRDLAFVMPDHDELPSRLDVVLEVLYSLFNEGYLAYEGDQLLRQDLCQEAIRLTEILCLHPMGQRPKVFALLALFFFQASRFNSRLNKEGELLLLEEQDRTLWDQELIQHGLTLLSKAAHGEELSSYHVEAGIASCHAVAASFESTHWKTIVAYYEQLLALKPTPIIFLNRAVALAMASGAEQGLQELDRLAGLGLEKYYLYHAAYGDFHLRLKNFSLAKKHFTQAYALTENRAEKKFLEKRMSKASKTIH